jgi:predicted transcriptional regulator
LNERFDEMVKLRFDISSTDRLTLLFAIRKEILRLTDLAEKISATIQETSRHLGRLTDAKLIEKNSDGSYTLRTGTWC